MRQAFVWQGSLLASFAGWMDRARARVPECPSLEMSKGSLAECSDPPCPGL